MKLKFIFLAVFIISVNFITGQNYFANPSFEDYNICEEYHQICATEAWFYTPIKHYPMEAQRVPRAILEKSILIIPMADTIMNRKVFVYTMLCCALEKGQKYKLSFFLNTMTSPIKHLDFLFSIKEPNLETTDLQKNAATFSIYAENKIADFKQGWGYIEKEFIASGGEKFCTIGNFDEDQDFTDEKSGNCYFIDAIKLEPLAALKLCDSFNVNTQKLYNQNYRHTNFVLINKDTVIHVPIKLKDTLILPNILFEINRADLNLNFEKAIDSLLDKFKIGDPRLIEISGYTDNSGNERFNNDLSWKRAETIKNYLIKKYPFLKNKILLHGMGSKCPISTNETIAGRMKNKRVEIVLTN